MADSIVIKEFDFDVDDPKMETNLQIIRETLVAISAKLLDIEERIEALEAP